ncbi:MAG: RNA 2',3'-cyclic phosphodiesterase [Meiothermus sp.]|uniref:RNA 2',3'-cyclic phosphodiesterase n=1 Tax=Meiothermus sp. TaxID=1955249 RepID=UPI0025D57DB8|nr:RNA 2',3'-cyclic phosphodiesterase [Meiothermus sp.]MCS7069506.1 RNA 2',3'-cyclic phosphodiesterase [Meiothermus sp.]MCX7601433.1 RNA 2',3'-cyclic phosphodiesterase [Meiothermus sp.]MDW8425758.1 RNA 2',3'-cyclic phosphodiesterase [Meiothermus sp.]
MRLFYAIFPPRRVQDALAEAQARVQGFKGWKLSPPHQLHITLLFLGSQPETRLLEFRRIGQEVAGSVPAFTVELGGTGYFPATGSPRVWFVKATGAGLEPLAEGLQRALPDINAHKFHPHLTLARKKGPAPRIGPLVMNLQFQAQAVCLVESKLERSGSQYRVIEQFPLA